MANLDTESLSEAELEAEFDGLFPQGFAGPDVLRELAPTGWQNSPLHASRRDIANRSRRPSKARRRLRSGLTRRYTAAFPRGWPPSP
jgi:hypothetical protein